MFLWCENDGWCACGVGLVQVLCIWDVVGRRWVCRFEAGVEVCVCAYLDAWVQVMKVPGAGHLSFDV